MTMKNSQSRSSIKPHPATYGELPEYNGRYELVPPKDLRDIWPMLLEGLEDVRATNGEPWIAEDVYAQLINGRAWLYLCYYLDSPEMFGFFIVEPTQFPFEYQQRLNVWIGWAKEKHRGKRGRMGIESAKRIAEALNYNGVVFATSQTGPWVKGLGELITAWYEA